MEKARAETQSCRVPYVPQSERLVHTRTDTKSGHVSQNSKRMDRSIDNCCLTPGQPRKSYQGDTRMEQATAEI